MSGIISKLGYELAELLYPVPCIGCGIYGKGPLCPVCAAQIRLDERKTGLPGIGVHAGNSCVDVIKAAGIYEGALKEMIIELKASFSIYAKPLASLMIAGIGNDPRYLTADNIHFVPSTREKLRKRGYNPARLLAEKVSGHLGIPLADALVKTRRTADQDSLPEMERWSNVEGVFRVEKSTLPGKCCILVDDVLTTGATAMNCARALISSGAEDVMVLVGGRALLRQRRNYQYI